MRFIKYIFWYTIFLVCKPIIKATLQEIEDGAQAFSRMKWKDIKKMFREL